MSNEFHPLVSIIIPVYNGAYYMCEAIDSALAQTYDNIEIIVVNDGSTDNSEVIAKSYQDKIRYLVKENGGVSTALNTGIINMKGEYFSWLSHDDLYTPDKILKNVTALKDDPMRIVYSNYDTVNEKGKYLSTVSAKELHRAADYEYGLFPVINGLVHGCSLLIHRSHFDKHGLFDENLRTTQDYDLWFKMFRGQKLLYVPESLVKGRVHGGQTTHTSKNTIEECDNLWINMLKSLTDEELHTLGGSKRNFWIHQALFMKESTLYAQATQYAFDRLKASTDELKGCLVSIITPFYNRTNLVLQCIQNVQQQSYRNWELILVNDGSTDDISEIKRNAALDSRIMLINSRHKGVAHARNTGLDAAKGKFIAFLDSDDTWDPTKLDKQLQYMLEEGYCASHTSYSSVNSAGEINAKIHLSETHGDVFRLFLYSCGIATPSVMVEREYWGDLRFSKGMDYGEDVCCWLELAWRGAWGYLPEALTFVYVGESSASQDKRKQQIGYVEIQRYILKKAEWAEYQIEIGILARDYADTFPKPRLLDTHNNVSRFNIPLRLINAVKRHGFVGVCKIFYQRVIQKSN